MTGLALVLHGFHHIGHIAHINRGSVPPHDDQIRIIFGRLDLALGLEKKRAGVAIELSRALVTRAGFDRRGQIVHGQTTGGKFRGVGLDADGRLRTEYIDLRNAGHDADALGHLGRRVIVERAVRKRVAGQRNIDDRLVVGVELGEGRRSGKIQGQTPGGLVDRRLNIGGRHIHALAQRELQRERSIPLGARRCDQVQSGNLQKLFFQRSGHIAGHRGRRCPGVIHADVDHRKIDHRQVVDRQLLIRKDTEQNDRHRQQDGHHRTTNERFRKAHDVRNLIRIFSTRRSSPGHREPALADRSQQPSPPRGVPPK